MSTKKNNPFSYGRVTQPEEFCPRPDIEKTLKQYISDKQNVYIQGERRIGKTSLVHHILTKIKKQILPISIDLMLIKDEADLIKRMATPILKSKPKGFKDLLNWISSIIPKMTIDTKTGDLSISPEFLPQDITPTLEGLLDMISQIGKKQNAVVFFDEFQSLLNLKNAENLLAILRSHIQYQTHVTYLFVGSLRNEMDFIFTSQDSPFYQSAVRLELENIDEKAMYDFVSKKFKKTHKVMPKELFSQLYEITQGIPGDIQQLCSSLWNLVQDGTQINQQHLKKAVEKILYDHNRLYERIAVELTSSQFRMLIEIAKNNPNSISSKDLLAKTKIHSSAAALRVMKSLIKKEILYIKIERIKKTYIFCDPFFRQWLLKSWE